MKHHDDIALSYIRRAIRRSALISAMKPGHCGKFRYTVLMRHRTSLMTVGQRLSCTGFTSKTAKSFTREIGIVRFVTIRAVLISALLTGTSAFAQTDTRTPPKIGDTKDADIKPEYLEAIPYKPCPSNVRFTNGQQMCLGLPGHPYYRSYNAPKQ